MKTYMADSSLPKKWYVVDAEGKTFGRLASGVAAVLMGKNKPEFTPNVDTGDYVIVVNADKLVFTGKKLEQKKYYHHSGYPGGLKEVSYRHMMEKKPEFLFKEAVRNDCRCIELSWKPWISDTSTSYFMDCSKGNCFI